MNANLPKSLDDIDFKFMNTIELVDEVKSEMKAILTHYAQTIGNGHSHTFERYSRESLKKYCAKIINDLPTHEQLDSILKLFKDEATNVPFPPPEEYAFTFIDLFAGIGGFRLAMQNLDGKCVFSSEWDKEAQKTYRANFGEVPFGDITKETTKRFIPDGFDILCAGFPCQAFSIAGKRGGFEDTRGTLFFDVAEIIKSKQPKAIFLENVKGLRNHDRGKTLETILNVLREDLGYFVPDPEIMNAKKFGVPQNRERLFIVGFRKDLNIDHFEYPKPLEKQVSFADIKEKNVVSTKYYLSQRYLSTLVEHKNRHAEKGNGFGYEIIPDHGISNAVVCGGMGRERNLVHDDRIVDFTPVTRIHGEVNKEGIRKMTPREWARLQGFPDSFIIPVADASAYKQFGNSVAVPAIQATANEIVEIIREKIMIKGNIGEWSEIYAFFKLLEEGKLYVGNALLERTEFFYPIVSILRKEGQNENQFANEGDVIIVTGTKPEIRIPKKKFAEMSKTLLGAMNESSGSFMVKEVEQFMKSMDCNTLKASSNDKSDIKVIIHDSKTGLEHNLGFNIKSKLGAPSTLLNASKATNIIYKLKGMNASLQSEVNQIKSFSEKFQLFEQKNIEIKYHDFTNKVFKNNLTMVDSSLPSIVSELALQYFKGKKSSVSGIMEEIKKSNPLEFDVSTGHDFYGHKVKRMLTDMALGMVPSKMWTGEYITSGGYLIVKEDGDVICYHIHDRTMFENYLFHNTKLETASTTKHGFGNVEKVGNEYFMNLNLQIRFR